MSSQESSPINIETIGEEVGLLEGIRTSSAIRRLKKDPVPHALIRKVCEAGTFAPSGGNRQPWSFIAVTDPERRAWFAERYRKVFDDYIAPTRKLAAEADFPESRRKIMAGAIHLADHLHEAPVHLFVAGWKRRGETQVQALFPAIENILLACRAVGLGASLTTLHRAFQSEVDSWLGLPEDRPTCAMIPIGWPALKHRRPVRRSIDSCLYFDRFEAE